MRAGYTSESNFPSKHHKIILVSNYYWINKVINMPCMEDSILIKYRSKSDIGMWKIKKLKNNGRKI